MAQRFAGASGVTDLRVARSYLGNRSDPTPWSERRRVYLSQRPTSSSRPPGDPPSTGLRSRPRPVAVVVGAGGVLAAAYVGVRYALDQRRLAPDVIIGSAVSALDEAITAARPGRAAPRPHHVCRQIVASGMGALHARLRSLLLLIVLGGFRNGAIALPTPSTCISSPARTVGSSGSAPGHSLSADGCSAVANGLGAFAPGRSPVHRLDPATHVGPRNCISPTAHLSHERSYLDRSPNTGALIGDRYGATAATDVDGWSP